MTKQKAGKKSSNKQKRLPEGTRAYQKHVKAIMRRQKDLADDLAELINYFSYSRGDTLNNIKNKLGDEAYVLVQAAILIAGQDHLANELEDLHDTLSENVKFLKEQAKKTEIDEDDVYFVESLEEDTDYAEDEIERKMGVARVIFALHDINSKKVDEIVKNKKDRES